MKKIYSMIAALMLTATLWAQAPQKMSYQAVIRNSSNTLLTNTTVGIRISILQSSVTGSAVYVETHTASTNANGLVSLEVGNGTIVSGIFANIDWANGPYFIKTETDPAGGSSYSISGTSQLLSVPYALFSKTAESVTGPLTETDPVFTNSPASNITNTDITHLSNLSGVNSGDQDGSETKVIGGTNTTVTGTGTIANPYIVNSTSSMPSGSITGEMLYWNGTAWVIVPAGTNGQYLVFCNGRPVWGGCSILTVVKNGTGTGTVASNISGISCGVDCNEYYTSGTTVVLSPTADPNSVFTGWSGGGCSGTGTCTTTINNATSVTATFTLNQYGLAVTKTGTGSGTVTSDVGSINCGATCSENFNAGTTVTLTATPGINSNFTGWTGACTGIGPCLVSMNNAKNVTANFNVTQYNLIVSRSGAGSGTVTSNVGGINCGLSCSASINAGTTVTLTAMPGINSTFTGWTGACSGTGPCIVAINNVTTVTANFGAVQYNLSVSKTGSGIGSVSSNDGKISCGSLCSAPYNPGAMVTLTATANANAVFTGWSGGGCTGTGTCTVFMNNATNVIANFNSTDYALNVSKNGNGTVTSDITGINCGADCNEIYSNGTVVNLTPTADPGYSFSGWTGACTGTGPCSITMNSIKNVTANFTVDQYNLSIARNGTGSGTVTADVGSINCGPNCSSPYNAGTLVTLTANPGVNSTFGGWTGGGCTGTGTCAITMNNAASVTATFNTLQYNLNVSKSGTGNGTVISNVGSINCGASCSEAFNVGTFVVLTATPSGGSTFTGWMGGGCSGTGNCNVTLNNATSVTAIFTGN